MLPPETTKRLESEYYVLGGWIKWVHAGKEPVYVSPYGGLAYYTSINARSPCSPLARGDSRLPHDSRTVFVSRSGTGPHSSSAMIRVAVERVQSFHPSAGRLVVNCVMPLLAIDSSTSLTYAATSVSLFSARWMNACCSSLPYFGRSRSSLIKL